MATFKHSGQPFDVIYSIPAIAGLGGGTLYLDPTGGEGDLHVAASCPRGRTGMDLAAIEFLRPLLVQQPCIRDVRVWNGERVDFNLNLARSHQTKDRFNFVLLYLRTFGLDESRWSEPWLRLAEAPISAGGDLIHRGLRFHSRCHWWYCQIDELAKSSVFVGTAAEHAAFTKTFGRSVPLREPRDAAELARLIAGAPWLHANRSLALAVAQGLGAGYDEESYDYGHHSYFQRDNGKYMHIIANEEAPAGPLARPAKVSDPLTFKHSGDLGDIIYSLPAVRELGGGILYLDPTGGSGDANIQHQSRMKFNQAGYETIRPLLVEQPYIRDVRVWNGEAVDYNLNAARAYITCKDNIAAAYLKAFKLDPALCEAPWLKVNEGPMRLHKPVILNRTLRYQSKDHVWFADLEKFAGDCVFIGHRDEHAMFQAAMECRVDYHAARDGLEIARILLGSQMLIGNQSFVMSLAVGLGTGFSMEVCDYSPNCVFKRGNGRYL